jgi:GH24 family phage-related lysozyme (muramidase)
MDALSELLALIRRFEGLRLSAYRCPAGIWTIGYGHTGQDVSSKTSKISLKEAERLLLQDALDYFRASVILSPILLRHPKRHIAISDFCFNLGLTRYKASTLKRRIDKANWNEASKEIMRWVWAGGRKLPGLILRRSEEAKWLY